jgi:hypothetical protein
MREHDSRSPGAPTSCPYATPEALARCELPDPAPSAEELSQLEPLVGILADASACELLSPAGGLKLKATHLSPPEVLIARLERRLENEGWTVDVETKGANHFVRYARGGTKGKTLVKSRTDDLLGSEKGATSYSGFLPPAGDAPDADDPGHAPIAEPSAAPAPSPAGALSADPAPSALAGALSADPAPSTASVPSLRASAWRLGMELALVVFAHSRGGEHAEVAAQRRPSLELAAHTLGISMTPFPALGAGGSKNLLAGLRYLHEDAGSAFIQGFARQDPRAAALFELALKACTLMWLHTTPGKANPEELRQLRDTAERAGVPASLIERFLAKLLPSEFESDASVRALSTLEHDVATLL